VPSTRSATARFGLAVFCSFLALLLLHELESRLEERHVKAEWQDVKRDLSSPKPELCSPEGTHGRRL
jgi:hypothetical protein